MLEFSTVSEISVCVCYRYMSSVSSSMASSIVRPYKRKSSVGPYASIKRRRNFRGKKYSFIPRWPKYLGDQPNRKFAKLVYSCMVHSTGIAAGALPTYEYRANGLYDPEVASGGHQPSGFDQLMEQYFHYTVIKSRCRVEMLCTAFNQNQVWCLAQYNSTGVPGTAYGYGGEGALGELPFLSKTLMPTSGDHQGGYRSAEIWFSAPAAFGIPVTAIIGDSRFKGTDSADPTEDAFFGLFGYVPTGAENSTDVSFRVTITYFAVFTEPRWFNSS